MCPKDPKSTQENSLKAKLLQDATTDWVVAVEKGLFPVGRNNSLKVEGYRIEHSKYWSLKHQTPPVWSRNLGRELMSILLVRPLFSSSVVSQVWFVFSGHLIMIHNIFDNIIIWTKITMHSFMTNSYQFRLWHPPTIKPPQQTPTPSDPEKTCKHIFKWAGQKLMFGAVVAKRRSLISFNSFKHLRRGRCRLSSCWICCRIRRRKLTRSTPSSGQPPKKLSHVF